ncbi:MAG: PD40 domain-containing protein, partial [Planctomycetaceae bacterium]|nr:PD40 domain-containing protein [Planctomycetaceae bacterium]
KEVYSIAWSPDGKQIATGSQDKTIRLWDMTGNVLHTMEGHTDIVSCLAWSSRGSRLASGSWDHTVRFWNPRTGRGGPVLKGHTYRVFDLEWHPEGTTLASAGDRSLRLWTLDGTPIRTVKTENSYINTLAWKHDGNEIVTGTQHDSVLRIVNVEGNADRAIGENLDGGAARIAWHPKGNQIAVGCRDKFTRLFTEDGRPGAILARHYYHVRALDWSPDGERLATSGDALLRIWNRQGVLLSETKESEKGNTALDWSPDGTAIAVVSLDGTARVYSAEGKKQTEIKLPQVAKDVAWGPDSQQFATMTNEQVQLWQRDGTPGPVLPNPPPSLVTMDWNFKKGQIAAGGWSRQYQTWNGKGEAGTSEKAAQSILDIAFSPDGERVAMAWFNNNLAFANADGSD